MSELVMLGRALLTITAFALMVGIATFAGCYGVMKPVAEYGIARQETEQTRIEWDGRVRIAEIQADATKKTSFNFVLFWVVRFAAWVLGLLVLGLLGITASQKYLAVAR